MTDTITVEWIHVEPHDDFGMARVDTKIELSEKRAADIIKGYATNSHKTLSEQGQREHIKELAETVEVERRPYNE